MAAGTMTADDRICVCDYAYIYTMAPSEIIFFNE